MQSWNDAQAPGEGEELQRRRAEVAPGWMSKDWFSITEGLQFPFDQGHRTGWSSVAPRLPWSSDVMISTTGNGYHCRTDSQDMIRLCSPRSASRKPSVWRKLMKEQSHHYWFVTDLIWGDCSSGSRAGHPRTEGLVVQTLLHPSLSVFVSLGKALYLHCLLWMSVNVRWWSQPQGSCGYKCGIPPQVNE